MPPLTGTTLTDTSPIPDRERWVARVRAAEAAGVDVVVIEPGPADAALVAALVAARTERIGILVRIATAVTEPFHVSTQLATIDVVSGGRAGWLVEVGALDGRTTTWPAPAGDGTADAAEHVDVVRALWDSWEDGAEVRDAAAGRFLDRSRVHHVDHVGEHLAIRGPSITPRPPQGNLPVVAAGPLAARVGADVVVGDAAPADGSPWLRLVAGADDAAAFAAAAALASGAGGPLRERFGLPEAVNRFAAAAGAR